MLVLMDQDNYGLKTLPSHGINWNRFKGFHGTTYFSTLNFAKLLSRLTTYPARLGCQSR